MAAGKNGLKFGAGLPLVLKMILLCLLFVNLFHSGDADPACDAFKLLEKQPEAIGSGQAIAAKGDGIESTNMALCSVCIVYSWNGLY